VAPATWRRRHPRRLALASWGWPARPRAERVARKEATVMLVVDVSPSMEATDVAPTRLTLLRPRHRSSCANSRVSSASVWSVRRNGASAAAPQPITPPCSTRSTKLQKNGPWYAAGDGLLAGLNAIAAENRPRPTRAATTPKKPSRHTHAIVLLSDGLTTVGGAEPRSRIAVDAANQQGVPVPTISFGTPSGVIQFDGAPLAVPADGALLAQIASDTGGPSFQAATGDELRRVYQDVAAGSPNTLYQRDLTMLFIGVALALALVGLTTSLVRRPRIA